MVNIKNINAINLIFVILSITLLVGCNSKQTKKEEVMVDSNKPVKVELKNNNGQFQIYVNNEPFYIKGAGLEFGNIASVAKHGGNSFRTWRTENGQQSGKEVLDAAAENGLMVTMGIEVARERHGFDYNDSIAVKEQLVVAAFFVFLGIFFDFLEGTYDARAKESKCHCLCPCIFKGGHALFST